MKNIEEGTSSSDEIDHLRGQQPSALRRGVWRAAPLTFALVVATAVLTYATGHTRERLGSMAARPSEATELFNFDEDPCNLLPYLRINKILRNNLGGKGPDKDVPEGIVYGAKAHRTGMNQTDVEVHLNVVSESYFGHGVAEGANVSELSGQMAELYSPEWPKVNGITGHFGTINIHPGTNVTLMLRGYDPVEKRYIHLPAWAMTFFDIDCGKDGNRSIEFLKMNNYKSYFVTNETELKITEREDFTAFEGTVEGTGVDNPDNPLNLTVLQKNRAVSFEFEDTDHVIFELGASPGKAARVFQFVVRPIMRCANTIVKSGHLPSHHESHEHDAHLDEDTAEKEAVGEVIMQHNDTASPIVVQEHKRNGNGSGAGKPAQPAAMVMLGLVVLAVQHML